MTSGRGSKISFLDEIPQKKAFFNLKFYPNLQKLNIEGIKNVTKVIRKALLIWGNLHRKKCRI
jgi:hypothetical protein